MDKTLIDKNQAQPNKIRLKEQQEDRQYEEKLLAKAHIIVDSANRIWRR
jgi:DNA polymerase theta